MPTNPRFNFKTFDPTYDHKVLGSGIFLPLALTLEQANKFIYNLNLVGKAEDIYEEDLMNYYSKLTNEEKGIFLLRDKAEALLESTDAPSIVL